MHLVWFRGTALADDLIGAGHGFRPVNRDAFRRDPELTETANEGENLSDPDQGLFGNSPVVQSGPAELVSLDKGNLGPESGGGHGCRPACRASADHNQVEGLG